MKATNVTHAAAADEVPVRDEIAALEQQILYRRERIKSRSYALEYQVRKRVTSPYTLLAAVAAGFVGERLLRGKQLHQPDAGSQPQQQARPQDEGFLSQALKAVTLVQGIMASPVVGMLRRQFDAYQAKSARESAVSRAYQSGNTQSANIPGSDHYH